MSALHATTRQPVEIPARLRRRPKDRRGYPIPYIVMIDKDGRPHFTINDSRKVQKCVHGKRCGLCGDKLERAAIWFVGGSRCFTQSNGAFIDPPMHEECARYALQVCPFLAAPSYAKRIDDRTLDEKAIPDGMFIGVTSAPMRPDQPEVFGLGRCAAFSIIPEGRDFILLPVALPGREKWLHVEFWKGGKPNENACQDA